MRFRTNGLQIFTERVEWYKNQRTSLVSRGRIQADDTYLDHLIRFLDPTQLAAASTLHFILDEDLLSDEDLATPVMLGKQGFQPKRIHMSIALQGQMLTDFESWHYYFRDPFRKMERNNCVLVRPGRDDWDLDWP